MKVTLNWKTGKLIPELLGHGIEVYYLPNQVHDQRFIIAFVNGFQWLHGYSNDVDIDVLLPEVSEFINLDLNGTQIINKMKSHLSWYLHRRKVPPHEIGRNFITHINT